MCSHSDRSPEGLRPADCAKTSNHCHFHCARGFATPVLAHMLDSLVRVSRRGKENHFVCAQSSPVLATDINSVGALPQETTKADTRMDHSAHTTSGEGSTIQTDTGFLRFRFSNFRYSLTALSRIFASFPHGTCTLSVSHQYLAFDGISHPL